MIHTGVVSIEAAIEQYVNKYAKTAKIKNIVDTFMHKLDEVGCLENTKKELLENQEISDRISKQIEIINKNIDDAKMAQKFSDAVDDAEIKVREEGEKIVEDITEKYQERLTRKIDGIRGRELTVSDATQEVDRLCSFAKKLEPDFQNDLNEMIRDNMEKTANALIKQYQERLASLTSELKDTDILGITIDPLKLMGSSVVEMDSYSIGNLVRTKKVEDGEEWVENKDKKWYKPWTWFQESGHYKTKYKNVEYISSDELVQSFLSPIQQGLFDNGENAKNFASKQSKKISQAFKKEFNRLDKVLKAKTEELKSYAVDKENAEERIKMTEKNLKWLNEIQNEVKSILDI